MGVVDYQDNLGHWRESASWPPTEARLEALWMGDGMLGAEAGNHSVAEFVAAPTRGDAARFCGSGLDAVLFLAQPTDGPVTIAGNPFVLLRIESSLPTGIVSVHLYDVAPEAVCSASGTSGVLNLRMGAADLRFHAGGYEGHDFPVQEPTHVRIDLPRLAHTLAPGHALAVAISGGDPMDPDEPAGTPDLFASSDTQPTPVVRLHGGASGGSHLVVPIVDGTLGGAPTGMDYPPRPFARP